MPVAFTEEQQAEIRKKLYDAAKNMVIDTPYHAIIVSALKKLESAGILETKSRDERNLY